MRSELLEEVRASCLPAIERWLSDFLGAQTERGLRFNAEMARYQLSTGGKRLRALIPCLVYSACGHDPLDAVSLGCALELIHNATLVHDDLQDGDVLRRGKPTVWKRYGAAQAINCGDAMFQLGPLALLARPDASPRVAARLLGSVAQVIEGQAQEFLLKDEPLPTVARYLEVVRGKTAALIAACFSIPALTLGESDTLCSEIERAGTELGILFQMQDDLLDIYGEKGRDRRATDIAEGKISVLVAQLAQDASPSDRERMLSTLRRPREDTTEREIDDVIGLFDRYGTKEKVLSRIEEIQERLRELPWRDDARALHGLIVKMGELFLEPIRELAG